MLMIIINVKTVLKEEIDQNGKKSTQKPISKSFKNYTKTIVT